MSLTGNEAQPCKNCGRPIHFSINHGCWLHDKGVWGTQQCTLYATPTTPIEGVDY